MHPKHVASEAWSGNVFAGACETESFARSIALCSPCSAQAQGDHSWSPVERMRSTHGRIHGVPKNAVPLRIHPRVYWQTHETNTVAMRLYDQLAEKSGFLVYRKLL